MFLLSTLATSQSPRIGGFDTSRCQNSSITQGQAYSQLRGVIRGLYPHAVFSGTPQLTSTYLDTVDVLMIAPGGMTGSYTVTTPLSQAEQSALSAFVSNGGRALIMVDNNSFGGAGSMTPAVNTSFVQPFGLSVGNNLPNNQVANANSGSHPILAGSCGTVASFMMGAPGWFTGLGQHAVSLARSANGNHDVLAVIDPQIIAPASGAVVLVSDMNAFDDGGRMSMLNNLVLSGNIISFLAHGSYEIYGSGCAGAAGTPTIGAISGSLRIGNSLNLTVDTLPPGGATFGVIGIGQTQLDLSPLQMPGCFLFVTNGLVSLIGNTPTPTTATWTLPIPSAVGLVGFNFYQQAFALDLSANPAGIIGSNAGHGVVRL